MDIKLICKPSEVVKSIDKLLELLKEEELTNRSVPIEFVNGVKELRNFLSFLKEKIKVKAGSNDDYIMLVKVLSEISVNNKKFVELLLVKEDVANAISFLAVEGKKKHLKKWLEKSLERTGTFEDEVFLNLKRTYFQEYLNALAIFYSLKALGQLITVSPLKEIRANIGDRLVEEYFADLIAGWIYEDYLKEKLRSVCGEKCVEVKSTGTDAIRKIKFANITGESDLTLTKESNEKMQLRLEIQRVGSGSVKSNRNNRKRFTKGEKFELKVELKKHKIEKSDFFIFIFGKGENLKRQYLKDLTLTEKILLIPAPKGEEPIKIGNLEISYSKENKNKNKSYIVLCWKVNENLDWKELVKSVVKPELEKLMYDFTCEGINQLCNCLTQLLEDKIRHCPKHKNYPKLCLCHRPSRDASH